ncbi:MAG: tRNA 4-thiouridine(8) synthase ThiI [Bacilli bacterium]|nr:tRNA 4-thiouridine(8) synthase ThiI [Bacilli bacterium]
MKYTHIIIKFGEIFLKKRNRFFFINKLLSSIKIRLIKKNIKIEKLFDHIKICLNNVGDNNDINEIIDILTKVSGIHSLSPIIQTSLTIDDILEKLLYLLNAKNNKTFKIFCKRNNKKFYLNSDSIIRILADKILEKTSLKVDVHNPEIKLFVEIRENYAYVYSDIFYACGGFPTGASGKMLMLISGGIDSPVASYMLINKGIVLDFIHFASPPYTSEAVIDKIKDILKVLHSHAPYKMKLYIIPLTDIQLAIYSLKNNSYAITLLRRMMYRIANRIAIKFNYLAIASGDSIGQVSSQTLESIKTIEDINENKVPLLRPLCAIDKIDIIKKAKEIKTFNISILPYEDCCTVFSTKKVQTKPDIKKVIELEKGINFNLIDKAIEKVQIVFIDKN